MLLKPVSLGCLAGINHSSRPPSRHCVSTTFQPPRRLESFSFRYSFLHRRNIYLSSFFFVVSRFSLFVCRVFRLWLVIVAQILAPEFSSPPQPRVALPSGSGRCPRYSVLDAPPTSKLATALQDRLGQYFAAGGKKKIKEVK